MYISDSAQELSSQGGIKAGMHSDSRGGTKAVNPKAHRKIFSNYDKFCEQEYGIMYNEEA